MQQQMRLAGALVHIVNSEPVEVQKSVNDGKEAIGQRLMDALQTGGLIANLGHVKILSRAD